jgi:2-polyprenyl-3-methyl-5-hydroxy-6-metoxy-1,4-benzoquinol methylase
MPNSKTYIGESFSSYIRRFESFERSFEFFEMWRYKSNEYNFHVGRIKVKTAFINTFDLEKLYENVELIKLDDINTAVKGVVKKEAIDRFHPNNINNKAFWQRARKSFPLLSVCGGECKSIKEVNEKSLDLSMNYKLLPFLLGFIEKNEIEGKEKLMIFEIGFGHGGVFNSIKDKCNYTGIDYVLPKKLKKYKNLIEINKSGIPDYFLDSKVYDAVYAVNVLQHCSQKDRFEYLTQAYSILKPGGFLLFSCILMTSENENKHYWGIKDSSGRGYLIFFNQLTEVDYEHELYLHLKSIGFVTLWCGMSANNFSIILQKPK